MVVLWKNNADNSHWLFWVHFSAWCFNQLCLERTSDTQLSQPAHEQIALQWLIQHKGGILHIFTVKEEAKQTSTPALPGLVKDPRCCQSPILPTPGRGRQLPVDLVVPATCQGVPGQGSPCPPQLQKGATAWAGCLEWCSLCCNAGSQPGALSLAKGFVIPQDEKGFESSQLQRMCGVTEKGSGVLQIQVRFTKQQ